MAFAHFTVATRDVAGTRDFFQETFGWTPIDRPSNVPMAAAWLTIEPGQEIHILEVPDFEPSAFEREFGRHVALSYPVSDYPELKK